VEELKTGFREKKSQGEGKSGPALVTTVSHVQPLGILSGTELWKNAIGEGKGVVHDGGSRGADRSRPQVRRELDARGRGRGKKTGTNKKKGNCKMVQHKRTVWVTHKRNER